MSTKNEEIFSLSVIDDVARSEASVKPFVVQNRVEFHENILESYCYGQWQPIYSDFMILIAAIEYCDRMKKRAKEKFSRHFHLTLSVHDQELWAADDLRLALTEVIELLTCDRWEFEFIQRRSDDPFPPSQGTLDLGKYSHVMAFSDGLDSLCVASLLEAEHGKDSLIKVRIGGKDAKNAKKKPFAAVPFGVNYETGEAKPESSFRSRGFKFAGICAIAACLSGVKKIIVPESGQGVLSPVLLPLRSQSPDYRNHPVFFRKMEVFVKELLGCSIEYEQPRLWHTKGQTLKAALDIGVPLYDILDSRSCWQSRITRFNNRKYQCGVCAACLLRRLSFYAAGVNDRLDDYVWQDLNAESLELSSPFFEGKERASVVCDQASSAVIHFQRLADIKRSDLNETIFNSHVFELSKALSIEQEDCRYYLKRLLKQHSIEWQEFISSFKKGSFINLWLLGS